MIARLLLSILLGLAVSGCTASPPDPPEVALVKNAIALAEQGDEVGLAALTQDPMVVWDGEEPRPAELADFVPGCELEAYELRSSVVAANGSCRLPEDTRHSWPFGMNFRIKEGKIVEIERIISEF